MSKVNIMNQDQLVNSLQVSIVKDIKKGEDFNPGRYFLVKNVSGNDISVTIVPAGQKEEVETILYQGWNPEIIKEVKDAPSGLQYGY